METDGTYSTTELCLVVYLRMQGWSHDSFGWHSRSTAEWVFDRKEDIEELLIEYALGEARVDPREFLKYLTEVKNELFDFVHNNKRATS